MSIKIWVDDIRPAPEGYMWAYTTNIAISLIKIAFNLGIDIDVIDLDHDAGKYIYDGGDYIKILDWLEYRSKTEKTTTNFFNTIPIRIHSMNIVGVDNMRRIIEKNNWIEIR